MQKKKKREEGRDYFLPRTQNAQTVKKEQIDKFYVTISVRFSNGNHKWEELSATHIIRD